MTKIHRILNHQQDALTAVCRATATWVREEVEHLNLQMPEHNKIKALPHAVVSTTSHW